MTSSAGATGVRRIAHSVNRFVIEVDDTFDNACRRFVPVPIELAEPGIGSGRE